MIDQYKMYAEQFSIGENDKWSLTEYNSGEEILKCTSVDFQVVLKEIYDRVEFVGDSKLLGK